MVQFTVDTFGKLDIAVNNATLTPDDRPANEFDEALDKIHSKNATDQGV